MKRRDLFRRGLLLLPLALVRPNPAGAVSSPATYQLNRFSIAGFQYYRGVAVLHHLKSDALLELVAEPENSHDEFAVRIEWQGHKLGYVPRSDNRHISRLLRQGAKLRARVVEVDPEAVPWQVVKVEVGLEVG